MFYCEWNDAQKFIAQMIAIFDAKELRRFNRPDGTITQDDSVIMLSDALKFIQQ